jgi:flagellar biosynthesis protein FlhB
MKIILLLFAMIFCHIVDDYYLQGILASMKQKAWWRKQESYNENYKYDYIIALIMHAFSWAFMIMLPFILVGVNQYTIVVSIAINTIIHAFVDDLKANKKKINLVQDQTIHIGQILLTWFIIANLI